MTSLYWLYNFISFHFVMCSKVCNCRYHCFCVCVYIVCVLVVLVGICVHPSDLENMKRKTLVNFDCFVVVKEGSSLTV